MKIAKRAAGSINASAWTAVIMLISVGAMVRPEPLLAHEPKLSAAAAAVPPTADVPETPLMVLTQENHRVEEVTTEGKASETKGVNRNEIRLVYPTPTIRHATATYQPIYPERTAAEQAIHVALARPVLGEWAWNEAPLRDVCERIEEQFGIRCGIDHRSLEAAGLDADTPVTSNLSGVSLRSALRHLLGGIDLTIVVKDNVLLITTKEKSEEQFEMVFYPMPTAHASAEIIDLIQSTIAADTWDIVGGPGAIRPLFSSSDFVVSQTDEIHNQIAKLMAEFDADLEPAGDGEASVAARVYPIRDPQLFAELQAKLVAVCNAALGEAADPAARVSSLGGKLVVQSASRPFHVYAAELVRSVNGVEVIRLDVVP